MRARAIFKFAEQIGPDEFGMKYVTREIELPDDFLDMGHFVGFAFDDEATTSPEGNKKC